MAAASVSASNDVRKRRRSNPVPAVDRITLEKATELWDRYRAEAVVEDNGHPHDESLHCWILDKHLQNGYPVASYSRTEANIPVSHLALRVTLGESPHHAKRQTASHLCHNKRCIRPEHIIIESIGLNGRRNGCLAFVTCGGCGAKTNACGHEPVCILPWRRS